MQADEIEYQIFGEEMQYVEIELNSQKLSLHSSRLADRIIASATSWWKQS